MVNISRIPLFHKKLQNSNHQNSKPSPTFPQGNSRFKYTSRFALTNQSLYFPVFTLKPPMLKISFYNDKKRVKMFWFLYFVEQSKWNKCKLTTITNVNYLKSLEMDFSLPVDTVDLKFRTDALFQKVVLILNYQFHNCSETKNPKKLYLTNFFFLFTLTLSFFG